MDEMKETDGQLAPLTEGIEKNLAKAAWKLSAGLLNIPLQKIDRHLAEKKAESNARIAETKASSDARIKSIQTVSDQISEQTNVPEEYVKLATDKSFEKIIQEQLNLEETNVSEEYVKLAATAYIGNIVQEQLSLDDILENAQLNLQNTPQDDTHADQNIEDISNDWLNEFRDVARKKSSEEAKKLFGKVLAGEIRKPGSFSFLTVTTLANMNHEVIQLFKTFCSLCLARLNDPNAYLSGNSYKIDDVRLPILRGTMTDLNVMNFPNQSILTEFVNISDTIFNVYDFDFQLLLEHGLIVDNTSEKYNHIWYNNELWGFMQPHNQTILLVGNEPNITISGLALTSVGRELFHIIKRQTLPQYWEKISKFIPDYYSVQLQNMSK